MMILFFIVVYANKTLLEKFKKIYYIVLIVNLIYVGIALRTCIYLIDT
jgi:hypothetical protein